MPLNEPYSGKYRPPSIRRTASICLALLVAAITMFELLFGGGEPVSPMNVDVAIQNEGADEVDSSDGNTPSSESPQDETPTDTTDAAVEEETKAVATVPEKPTEAAALKSEDGLAEQTATKQPKFLPLTKLTPAKKIVPAETATADKTETKAGSTQAKHVSVVLRGRIVWLNEALKRRYNIATPEDAAEQMLILESEQGTIHPIVDDTRGRAFRLDERLRDRPVEILARRYIGSPMLQVIRLYALREDGRYELDYWCDICAIQMFQHGVCDCCQGDNRMRERKVESGE